MVEKEDYKKIWTVKTKSEELFLREKAKVFQFSEYSKSEINNLILIMRQMMVLNHGIGLAAPQIGLNAQVFVAQLPSQDGRGYQGKFYAVFNPKVESISKKLIPNQEGCLSVPGYYGTVERANKITVSGYDKNNRAIKLKVEDFLARIFQHEIDHLNGTLFIDKSKDVKKFES